jgi:quercetin dioxygenase-like cupin family protein
MADFASLHRWDELALEKITEMVARKTVATAEHRLTQAYLKQGALVPRHAHEHEQVIYVLQGAIRMTVGGDVVTAREGDVLVVAAGAPHQAETLDDSFVIVLSRQ